jgi:predicted ester cyclase
MHRGALWPGTWAGGSPRIWLDATATLKERDTGECGQPVHQLVLEGRVTDLCCGRLSLPVVPVAAAHGCGAVVAEGFCRPFRATGVSPDTAGMKQFIAGLHAAFSEVVITIEDMVAEGDRLVGRWVMRGTNTGSFNGMPATGRTVTLSGFDLLRVEGDRFAEVWHVEDIAGMLQQLGVIPQPGDP